MPEYVLVVGVIKTILNQWWFCIRNRFRGTISQVLKGLITETKYPTAEFHPVTNWNYWQIDGMWKEPLKFTTKMRLVSKHFLRQLAMFKRHRFYYSYFDVLSVLTGERQLKQNGINFTSLSCGALKSTFVFLNLKYFALLLFLFIV